MAADPEPWRVRSAIVPAAGLGTRLLPASLAVPKELLPLGLYPAICATVLEALAANLDELVVVIAPNKEEVRRFLTPAAWGRVAREPALQPLAQALAQLSVRFVEQPRPFGALDAIERGLAHVSGEGPCAILFPDLLHLPDQRGLCELIAAHALCQKTVFGLYQAGQAGQAPSDWHGPSARVILAEDRGEAEGAGPWRIARVEPGAGPPLQGELRTTFGTIHTSAYSEALSGTTRPAPGAPPDDACHLDALNVMAAEGELYGCLLPGEVLDLGRPSGYLEAARRFATGEACLRGFLT